MNDKTDTNKQALPTDRFNLEFPPATPTYMDRMKAAEEVWPYLKPPWHPHLPGRECPVAEAFAPPEGGISPEEDYGFDVQGFLIIRGALSKEELRECNALLDRGVVPVGLSAHPTLTRYVEQLCGLAYRVDKPITMLERIQANTPCPMVGGNEPYNASRVYINQGHGRFCQGVHAIWALADMPAGAGGYKLLRGSHTINVPVPDCVLNGEDTYLESLGMSLQPVLQAGDLLLHASILAHSPQPWCYEGGPQRLAICEFVSVYARPSDFSADSPTEGGKSAELPWMINLSPEERIVLGLADTPESPASPLVSDGRHIRLGTTHPPDGSLYHPGLYDMRPSSPETVDPMEFFYWELTGFLVVRKVMDQAWLDEANAAVDANMHRVDFESSARIQVGGSAKMQGTGRPGLEVTALPEEHRTPFQKMLAHPALVHRLNWMLGGHFRAYGMGGIITTRRGGGGQILHGGGDPVYSNINWWIYRCQNGRCYTGQVNVTWQLRDVTDREGGFVVVPGSHHARFPLPSNDSGDPAGHKGVFHPQMRAGDVLFFMGGAACHGAWAWHNDVDRRCVLNAYWSKDMARQGWVNNLK
ncbi:MAG: phytanoyl-CoA dioxygenase family protein [candidate division Zixibacteria bacterium]|nr:phytanoyl-CoA dioxygenase family protein [candidate division Zixibacteria bacterium]